MSSSGNAFNFGSIQQTASGDGAVNQVGNNTATTTVNKGEDLPTIPEFFGAIKQELPTGGLNESGSINEGIAPDDSAEDINESILMPLQTMAELPEAERNTPDAIERAQSLINRLIPYAPIIGKGLAVFGNAALSSLASSNPIISGILAVCRMAAEKNE